MTNPRPVEGLSLDAITMDSSDAAALAAWWAGVVGGRVAEHGDFFFVANDHGRVPSLGFQQVPDRTPGKNATHLDLKVPDAAAAVAQLVAAGASHVARHALPDGFAWDVLADPQGNQFCVLQA